MLSAWITTRNGLVYNRVTIDLTTHEAGGVTTRDFELVRQIETIVS